MPRGMEGGELSDEGIQQADSRFFEVPGISRDDRQIEHEREGRDLLVAGVVRVQGHQLPPDMGARRIERKDPVGIFFGQKGHPGLKDASLERSPLRRIISSPCPNMPRKPLDSSMG